MSRKKKSPAKERKGFYCFSRDLLSSQRYRRCSWTTKGVYLDTLNVLALQSRPGALCLKDFDLKPKSERSLTYRCLQCQKKAKNGEYQSIKYFAEAIAVSASGSRTGLIHGLQELYLRGIIVIEGDTLIQPRMFRDNGFEVGDIGEYMTDIENGNIMVVAGSPDDGEADPDAERMRLGDGGTDNINKGKKKSTHKTPKNDPKNPRVGAGDAHAQSKRVGVRVRDNNINNGLNIDSNSGINPLNTKEKDEKTALRKMSPVADNPPTLDEVCAYFAEREAMGKPLEYITAEEYYSGCETDGWTHGKDRKPIMNWKTFALGCDTYRRNHGDMTVAERQQEAEKQKQEKSGRGQPQGSQPTKQGEAVPATPPAKGKYKKW